MRWLETLAVGEASAAFVLAAMNCGHLVSYARHSRSPGRRAGAGALALVCAAVALESMAFLASPALQAAPLLRDASVLVVRSGLLLASAAVSALLLRAGRSRA